MQQKQYQEKIEEIVRESKSGSFGLSESILKLDAVAEGDIEDIIKLLGNSTTYISGSIRKTLKENISKELTPVFDKVTSTINTTSATEAPSQQTSSEPNDSNKLSARLISALTKSNETEPQKQHLEETLEALEALPKPKSSDSETIEEIVKHMKDFFHPTKQPGQSLFSLVSPDNIIQLINKLGELDEAQKADILSRGGAPKNPNPLQKAIVEHFSETLEKKVIRKTNLRETHTPENKNQGLP